jgi:UDP-N-acetylmuramoylalanine--D-glutamate ligase
MRHISTIPISMKQQLRRGMFMQGSTMSAGDNINQEAILDLATLQRLPGEHNWQNCCAAFAACRAAGLSKDDIIKGLQSFPGLAHRQQLIDIINGVRFVNDSKATNADATSKALICYDPIYWILGGLPKEGGLNGLEEFSPRVRHAFLIGKASDDFAVWLERQKIAYTKCQTLDVATRMAADMAWREKLDKATVLLSPACASWDQFSSFEHRGDTFASLARGLQQPETVRKAVS